MNKVIATVLFLSVSTSLFARAPQTVSLRLEDAPLSDGLSRLSAQTGIDFVYADALVSQIRIRCHFREETLETVMDRLLETTGLGWKQTAEDRMVLFVDQSLFDRATVGTVTALGSEVPLEGVSVVVDGSHRVAITDTAGFFRFPGLDPEKGPVLTARAPGFNPATVTVRGPGPIRLWLEPAPHISEHLRVSAGPSGKTLILDGRGGDARLSPDAISATLGDLARDLFDQLSLIPGVSEGDAGDPGVSFRGGAPSESLVVLDGIKIYQGDHSMGYYSSVNTDALSEIRVFKSAYPARYANRISGVLDMNLRGVGVERPEIRAGINREIADLTAAFPLGRGFSGLVSARTSVSDDISNRISARVFEQTFNEELFFPEDEEDLLTARTLTFDDVAAKLGWQGNHGWLVTLSLFHGEDRSRDTVDFLDEKDDLVDVYDRNGRWGNEGFSLKTSRAWGSSAQTEITLSRSSLTSDFDFLEIVDVEILEYELWETKNSLEESEFRLDQSMDFGSHQLEAGLVATEIVSDYRRFRRDPDRFGSETRQVGFYIQETARFQKDLELSLGFHARADSQTGREVLEPRLAIAHEPDGPWSFRASWGRFHQFILRSADTLNYFEGAETWFLADDWFVPGSAEHRQLGARFADRSWTVNLEVYHKDVEGTLARLYDPVREVWESPQTIDEIQGLDLFVRKRVNGFAATLAYGYLEATALERVQSGEPLGHPSDRDIPHNLKLVTAYEQSPWRASLVARMRSGRPYGVPGLGSEPLDDEEEVDEEEDEDFYLTEPEFPNSERLSTSFRIDASVRTSFLVRDWLVDLGLTIRNLTDEENILYRYYAIDEEEDNEIVPVDVTGFGLRAVLDLRVRY